MDLLKLKASIKIDSSEYEKTLARIAELNGEQVEGQLDMAEAVEKAADAFEDAADEMEKAAREADQAFDKLDDSVDEVTDSADELGDHVEDSASRTHGASVIMVAAGTMVAHAFEAALSAVVDLGKQAYAAAAEYDSSFAKVKTIMDSTAVSQEQMKADILAVSSEVAVSANDIANSVYDVISATGDTQHAVSLVRDATKLAKGGFAETGDAVSVLTTAINAYGLSLDDTTRISDSLITVQNLGVTSVGQLASAMGKAIATGSAFGVNLGNLEASYIALTKAGIATAEATTYMSSMINELGDSGSTVGKIIEEKTGKSFSVLMNEGNSLSDVLKILNDSVDGDSAALMNLWGSAEAGKASAAIAGQGLEQFNDWLQQVENSAGATEEAYKVMAGTLQEQTDAIWNKIKNLGIVVMEPFADKMANEWLPAINEAIDNVDIEKLQESAERTASWIENFYIKKIYPFIHDWDKTWSNLWYHMDNAVASGTEQMLDKVQSWGPGWDQWWSDTWMNLEESTANALENINLAVNKWGEGWDKWWSDTWMNLEESAANTWENIKLAVNKWGESWDQWWSDTWTSAERWVADGVQKIKDKLKFDWSLPHINLPHFEVTGGFSLVPPQVPSVAVEWYAKAMNSPMILDSPTIFGQSRSGQLLGAGEAGPEVVAGAGTLMNMISTAAGGRSEELLRQILNELRSANASRYEVIVRALETMKIDFDRRELARLIREYA